jgi:hypothetical protein
MQEASAAENSDVSSVHQPEELPGASTTSYSTVFSSPAARWSDATREQF